MPYKMTFYASEDELSIKLLNILSGLVREVGNRCKLSSKYFLPSETLTLVKITLPTTLGKSEELECEVWTTVRTYEEYMKKKFGLKSLPALKVGREVLTGSHVLDIALDLHTLLSGSPNVTAERVFYQLATTIQRLVEKEKIKATVLYSDIVKSTISERLAELERLLKEGKIKEETYKKMKLVLKEIMGKYEE
ncbi:MAG: hypothetical protein ABDH32_05625 [Candidatus Caldarchaeales archaeon]